MKIAGNPTEAKGEISMLSERAKELIANPPNMGTLETPTHRGVAGVPGDGPYMILELEVAEGQIRKAAFQTYGCASAIACGCITTLLLTGRTLEQASLLTAEDIVRVLQGLPEGKEHCPQMMVQALNRALRGE